MDCSSQFLTINHLKLYIEIGGGSIQPARADEDGVICGTVGGGGAEAEGCVGGGGVHVQEADVCGGEAAAAEVAQE